MTFSHFELDIDVQVQFVRTKFFMVNNDVVEPELNSMTKFQTGFRPGITQPDQLVFIRYEAVLSSGQKENVEQIIYAQIITETFFRVANIEEYKATNSYKLPAALLALLVEIANSTTRGILLGRGAGTIIEKMTLPLISGPEAFKGQGFDADSIIEIFAPTPEELEKIKNERKMAFA
jgi:hypothetical protein